MRGWCRQSTGARVRHPGTASTCALLPSRLRAAGIAGICTRIPTDPMPAVEAMPAASLNATTYWDPNPMSRIHIAGVMPVYAYCARERGGGLPTVERRRPVLRRVPS
jgi:hypothetical protein